MNEAKALELMFKGMLSECSEEEQAKINEAAAKLRAVVAEYGVQGFLALTVVAAEETAKN